MSRQTRIAEAVSQALNPLHLELVDESHLHAVPPGAESHFRLLVVSESFAGQAQLARQRTVNRLLRPEFDQGLHALALHTWTPEEWFEKGTSPTSPPCLGGSADAEAGGPAGHG